MVDSRDIIRMNDNSLVKIVCTIKSCVRRTSRNDKKYYFIVAEDETGEFKSMFMEREYAPFLQKGKILPEKNSIAIIWGRKSDTTVFVHDINVLDNKIYMKLSDLK
jgi:DNA polymerase III alpha subunit